MALRRDLKGVIVIMQVVRSFLPITLVDAAPTREVLVLIFGIRPSRRGSPPRRAITPPSCATATAAVRHVVSTATVPVPIWARADVTVILAVVSRRPWRAASTRSYGSVLFGRAMVAVPLALPLSGSVPVLEGVGRTFGCARFVPFARADALLRGQSEIIVS